MTVKKKDSIKKPAKKPAFLPVWKDFSIAIEDFIQRLLARKVYNRAAYFSDLSWLLTQLTTTSYAWFTESKTNWEVMAGELERMSQTLGGDLQFTIPMGKLDQDMYHYADRCNSLIRRMQFDLEADHQDWYKDEVGQPLALNEIAKIHVRFTANLYQHCNDGPSFLLRSADRKWCLQAHDDLNVLYKHLGIDYLFDPNAEVPVGSQPWSGGWSRG